MIEEAWRILTSGIPIASQMRVCANHPHDIYADFEPSDRVGLVVVTSVQPPSCESLHAITIEHHRRGDGRWLLRLSLVEPQLRPVFTALCSDIIACTRSGVADTALGGVVVARIAHWRDLLERGGGGLDETTLRGLVGELAVLLDRLLPATGPLDAVRCWTGPQGRPQDFQLPSGRRLEVKAVGRTATQVRINGLDQLDAGGDPLTLVVVRLEPTGAMAPGAVSATSLVASLRSRLAGSPEALALLEQNLAGVGWHEHPRHEALVVRIAAMEGYDVDEAFPRMTSGTVPRGIVAADYVLALPPGRGHAVVVS